MEPKERFDQYLATYQQDSDYQFEGVQFDLMEQMLAVMERKNISKTQLAVLLGCSKPYITKLLKGDQNLTLKTVHDIAFALDHQIRVHFVPQSMNLRAIPVSPEINHFDVSTVLETKNIYRIELRAHTSTIVPLAGVKELGGGRGKKKDPTETPNNQKVFAKSA